MTNPAFPNVPKWSGSVPDFLGFLGILTVPKGSGTPRNPHQKAIYEPSWKKPFLKFQECRFSLRNQRLNKHSWIPDRVYLLRNACGFLAGHRYRDDLVIGLVNE